MNQRKNIKDKIRAAKEDWMRRMREEIETLNHVSLNIDTNSKHILEERQNNLFGKIT